MNVHKRIGAKNIAVFIIINTILFPLFGLIGLSIVYSPEYIYRIARWWKWDVGDYDSLPYNQINTISPAYEFPRKINKPLVASLLGYGNNETGLEQFLFETDTTSFIIIQNGAVIYESYPKGYPYRGGYHSFSIAKSFISALTGIAIEKGAIQSETDSITKYIPELLEQDHRFSLIKRV